MADRLSTEIWIGGDIPEQLVPELCAVIRAENVTLDWGARPFQPQTVGDLLAPVPNGETLRLCDEQASWGCFQELEKFLQKHRIAFRRRCEGRYECEPQLVEHRPGYDLVELDTNAGGYPVVLALDLLPVRHLLEAALEVADGRPAARTLSLVETALKTLRAQLPRELPPLEPLRVVPDDGRQINGEQDDDSEQDDLPQADESQAVAATQLPKWASKMDWALLQRQKEWLMRQDAVAQYYAKGLINLLDALQDYAVDELGLREEVVLPGTRSRSNEERAARAERALTTYSEGEALERDDVLTDLLTDLRHYCQQRDMDWNGALEIVAMHFREEQPGE